MAMRVVFFLKNGSINYLPENAHEAAHNSLQERKYCL